MQDFDDNDDVVFSYSELFLIRKAKREYRDHKLEFLIKSGGVSIVNAVLEKNYIHFPWPEGRLASTDN